LTWVFIPATLGEIRVFCRATGHAIAAVHDPSAADRAQLCGEPAPLQRVPVRQALPRRAVPVGQQRAQPAESESSERLAVEDARDRPGAEDIGR
jgi:hypothetical protein